MFMCVEYVVRTHKTYGLNYYMRIYCTYIGKYIPISKQFPASQNTFPLKYPTKGRRESSMHHKILDHVNRY